MTGKAMAPLVVLLALAAALACGAPGGDRGPSEDPAAQEPAESPAAPAELSVRDGRVVVMPGGMTAVYLTVDNPTPDDDRLLSIRLGETPVELHESVLDGDTVRMEPRPDGYDVPAGARLELAPGGSHGMLVEPELPESPEESVELTLTFERAGERTVEARLERPGGEMAHDHGM